MKRHQPRRRHLGPGPTNRHLNTARIDLRARIHARRLQRPNLMPDDVIPGRQARRDGKRIRRVRR